MQAIKEKLSDMNAMRKAKAEAREEEKAEKESAKARVEVAHEMKLAREAEAAMDLHAKKAAEKMAQHEHKISHHTSNEGAEGAVHGGYNPKDGYGSNNDTSRVLSPTLSTDTVYDSAEAGYCCDYGGGANAGPGEHTCNKMKLSAPSSDIL